MPLDWAYDRPAYWEGPRTDGDELTDDLCVWTDDGGERAYFVRGVLLLPVRDSGEVFGYGVWSSLSERSYARLLQRWDDEDREHEPHRPSPILADLRAQLPRGAVGATLSGSGPSVLVWADDPDTAAAELRERFPAERVLPLAVAARGAL